MGNNKNIENTSINYYQNFTLEEKKVLTEKIVGINGKIYGKEINIDSILGWSNRGIGHMKVWF